MRVKVPGTGTTYGSPEEAFEAAAELEQLRDDEVEALRERGDEAGAERAFDRYSALVKKTRAAARDALAKEAGRTKQPAKRPAKSARTRLRERAGIGAKSERSRLVHESS